MAYGIRVENNSGFTQIDQDFVNYVLVASGSFSSSGNNTFTQTHVINFSALVSSSDTIFFARPATVTGLPPNTSPELIGDSSGTAARIISLYTGTIQWRVYERANVLTPPSSGYGLNVYRPNGELAFSSQYKVPRIFGIVEGIPNFSGVGVINHSYSAIPYALMQNGYEWAFYLDEGDPVPNTVYYMSVGWTATSVGAYSIAFDTFNNYGADFMLTGVRAWAFIQE
jgi:hypothetical protein